MELLNYIKLDLRYVYKLCLLIHKIVQFNKKILVTITQKEEQVSPTWHIQVSWTFSKPPSIHYLIYLFNLDVQVYSVDVFNNSFGVCQRYVWHWECMLLQTQITDPLRCECDEACFIPCLFPLLLLQRQVSIGLWARAGGQDCVDAANSPPPTRPWETPEHPLNRLHIHALSKRGARKQRCSSDCLAMHSHS